MSILLNPGAAIGAIRPVFDEKAKSDLQTRREWPSDVKKVPIPIFDTGVFNMELLNEKILPKKIDLTQLSLEDQDAIKQNPEVELQLTKPAARLEEGTYRGTQLALTKIYDLIETKYKSFMDTANFEPTVPSPLTIEKKREFYIFTDPDSDNYPPHLNLAANKPAADLESGANQKSTLTPGDLFNKLRLAQLTTLVPTLLPKKFLDNVLVKVGGGVAEVVFGDMGTPDQGTKLSDVERYNKRERESHWFQKDIFDLPNIGDFPDWYSDARFAQQSFTGTNPTTIELASDFWIQHFINAAVDPADSSMRDKIKKLAVESKSSLYMQDYSYFRKAADLDAATEIKCPFEESYEENGKTKTRISYRYGCASVCLFHLKADGSASDGQLRPLAIVIDWRGSSQNSVTIYNRELNLTGQATDWPWRYAKTCVQSSDWIRHEVTAHLCRTHLVEEATIVATNRTIPPDHIVFQILYPHWQKTLSLNAAARDVLVPHVIIPLVGMADKDAYRFLRSEYETFNFTESYIPEDLKRRGFPPEKLDEKKFHNYAWAKCIYSMWNKIRAYVEEMLLLEYRYEDSTKPEDMQKKLVKDDKFIEAWYKEMQETKPQMGAIMSSFPTITTLKQLIDAVTMCIHLASPQHTSVNYLQNFYQAFVVNRPPCLYRPLPKTLKELKAYKEVDLVAALPMNHTTEWLLASHIPYLLSFKPGDKESLIIYAASKYHVYKFKTSEKEKAIAKAAAKFYTALAESETEFKLYGQQTDDAKDITYDVLSPSWNAVSILI